jgi:hypothetical protein
MHSVQSAVVIGIEFGFDPDVIADPHIGIIEPWHDLRFPILEDWNGPFGFIGFFTIHAGRNQLKTEQADKEGAGKEWIH